MDPRYFAHVKAVFEALLQPKHNFTFSSLISLSNVAEYDYRAVIFSEVTADSKRSCPSEGHGWRKDGCRVVARTRLTGKLW